MDIVLDVSVINVDKKRIRLTPDAKVNQFLFEFELYAGII